MIRRSAAMLACAFALATTTAAIAASALRSTEAASAFPTQDRYGLVNDHLGVLTVEQSVALAAKLQALERSNGTQIVFLSVPSVGDESRVEYAIRMAEHWDIGNNGEGNGVLFLVTQSQGVQIVTGPGIAGALPDAFVARIIRETLEPLFQRGEFAQGVLATADELIRAAKGETTSSTSFDYSHLDGVYLSPAKSAWDRWLSEATWRDWMVRMLVVVLVTYVAALARRWLVPAK